MTQLSEKHREREEVTGRLIRSILAKQRELNALRDLKDRFLTGEAQQSEVVSLLDSDSQVAKPDCWPDMAAVNREYAATRMRDECVNKVREYLSDCRDEERGIIEAIAVELSSLTLDRVKSGEM